MKKVDVSVGRLVPVAKPQKKAFSTAEFYKQNMTELFPSAHRWVVSSKEDGIRIQLHKDKTEIKFLSDEAKPAPRAKIPKIYIAVKKLPTRCILDGELELYLDDEIQEHQGVTSMLRKKGPPTPEEVKGAKYIVWDILFLDDKDLTEKPYAQRLNILRKLRLASPVGLVKFKIVGLQGIPQATRQVMSIEGAIIRASDSTYWQDNLLFKLKKTFDLDVVIQKKEIKKDGVVYHVGDKNGKFLGKTFKQNWFTTGKPGQVVRITVTKIYKTRDPKTGLFKYSIYAPGLKRPPDGAKPITSKRADGKPTLERIWKATVGR